MPVNEAKMTATPRFLVNNLQPLAAFVVVLLSPVAPLLAVALPVVSPTEHSIVPAQYVTEPSNTTFAVEGWRLVRTAGPDKTDVISIIRTADIMQSDAEFAGMMIRCRPNSGLQIAFAMITPFHPRSKPKVTVSFDRSDMQFQGEVIAPGSLVAMPNEAEVLAKDAWQSAKALTVDIEGEGTKIHGIVSLANLSAAVSQLQANCPQ